MPTMQEIFNIIESGAKSAMTLEQIIKTEIDDWLLSLDRQWMLVGQKYYAGDSDILDRKRLVVGEGGELVEAENVANNKLVHNFLRKLTDQKTGYLLSKPLSIQTVNKTYANLLGDFFDKSFLRLLKNLGKEAVNKGRAWLHVYYDESGQLSFKKIPSEEIIPLWRDAAHTDLDAVIRVYDIEAYLGTEKKTITKVEFWDRAGVKRYELTDGGLIPDVELGEFSGHFSVIQNDEEQQMNWERIPFVCFKYNDEEIPLAKFVKSLIDDYDKKKSDNSNNLEDLPNSIYVVKEYDGVDLGEFRRNLSVFRAVKVTGDGGVDTISLEIDTLAYNGHQTRNYRDIFSFGRGVNFDIDKIGNSPSGIALKFLYSDLDMDANIIETEFQASLERLLWFIDQHIANTTGKDFSNEDVEFIFNRDIIINETDTITNAKNSAGIVSRETITANHPWTASVEEELDRLAQEQQKDLDKFTDYPEPGGNDDGETS